MFHVCEILTELFALSFGLFFHVRTVMNWDVLHSEKAEITSWHMCMKIF